MRRGIRQIKGLHSILLLAATTATTLLAACAGTDGSASGNRAALNSDCILNRRVRDYDVLDDRNLILYGPGQSAYHVEMATRSINIRNEIAIGLLDDDEDNRICPFGRDAILVSGPLNERIPIRSIAALDATDIEALKVQFGAIEAAGDAVTVTQIE